MSHISMIYSRHVKEPGNSFEKEGVLHPGSDIKAYDPLFKLDTKGYINVFICIYISHQLSNRHKNELEYR